MTNKEIDIVPFAAVTSPPDRAAETGARPNGATADAFEEVSLPLSHYLWVVRRNLWSILGFVAAIVAVTVIVTARITPVYQSSTTLYIDQEEARGIVGQASQERQNLSPLDSDSFISSQLALILSDSVVRPVAEKYRLLDVESQIRREVDRRPAKAAPIVLKELRVARKPNTSIVLISYRSTVPKLSANVANDIAESFIAHSFEIRIRSAQGVARFMEQQIEELRARMETSSARVAKIERELNVINPEERTNILSQRLTQLNSELTTVQGERVRAQADYEATRSGELDAAQVSVQGEALKKLIDRRNEVDERFAETRSHFGPNHPEFLKAQAEFDALQSQIDAMRTSVVRRVELDYVEASRRERILAGEVAAAKAEIDSLSGRFIEYQRAKREADADKALYEELTKKIREAGINAGFQNNLVRIADYARPAWRPVFPRMGLNVGLALLFSTLLAIGIAILADLLDSTVREADQITRLLRTDVIGSIPEVRLKGDLLIGRQNGSGCLELQPAGEGDKDRRFSAYDESVRTIRNTLLLLDPDRRLRSVLLTSATASEGKSTLVAHLAVAHAQQRHRTLIVDCDLRRPSQHRVFDVRTQFSLTDVLNGHVSWREALHQPIPGLPVDLIVAGGPSRRAAEYLGQFMSDTLEEIAAEYDLVLVDAPPLLGFAETLHMATAVDGVVVLTRAGETNRKAVAATVATLEKLRARVLGVVLNRVKPRHSKDYYYYGYDKYYRKSSR